MTKKVEKNGKEPGAASNTTDAVTGIREDIDWTSSEFMRYVLTDKHGISRGIREDAPQWVKESYERDVEKGKAPVFMGYS